MFDLDVWRLNPSKKLSQTTWQYRQGVIYWYHQRGREPTTTSTARRAKENTMTTTITTDTTRTVISKYDVMRAGKVVETFDTYDEARRYADKYRGAVIRYYVSTK